MLAAQGGEDVPEQPGPLHMPRNDEASVISCVSGFRDLGL